MARNLTNIVLVADEMMGSSQVMVLVGTELYIM